jgi:hypothetical protein
MSADFSCFFAEALEVQLDGIARLEEAIGKDAKHVHLVTAYHAIAFSFAVLRQFREAIQYEQRSRAIARSLGSGKIALLLSFSSMTVLCFRGVGESVQFLPGNVHERGGSRCEE